MDELSLNLNTGITTKLKTFAWTKEAIEMLLDLYGNSCFLQFF